MSLSSQQAMPLRIALLAQSACASELSADQISTATSIRKIVIESDFQHSLQMAIDAVLKGECVELISGLNDGPRAKRLLMLSALTAAKGKIHPDAYFSGYGADAKQALLQAKRRMSDVSFQPSFGALSAAQQFSELFNAVEAVAARSLSEGYWFTQPHRARVALLTFNAQSSDSQTPMGQKTASLVLTQATGLAPAKSLLSNERVMFVVSGQTESSLEIGLAQLSGEIKALDTSNPLGLLELMRANLMSFQQSLSQPSGNVATPMHKNIVIQASSAEGALKEISVLSTALTSVFTDGSHYKTPSGSCFSAAPKSKDGVTFVYPGVGTVYPGMLAEFHRYFPSLFARLEREGNLEEMLQARKTYAAEAQDMSLSELAIAGVGSSYLLTQLLCEEFQVIPDFALGYSKGEASMWASLGVWRNPHALIEMTQTSPIFTTAISGELTAVRQDWQLDSEEEIQWNSFVVRCDAHAIETLLPEFPRAYLAIIQGDTCVLAGCEVSCRALLKKLGKRGIAANRVTAMHTTPALSQHAQVRDFYTQPLFDSLPEHIRFISAAGLPVNSQTEAAPDNLPIRIDSDSIAKSIADTFCATLDFTSLIRSARKQGARLFIEVGADRQTSTLIDKINRNDGVSSGYCTIAANAKGGDDVVTLLKCIGQLITHQIPLSVSPLLTGLEHEINRVSTSCGLSIAENVANYHQGEPV
ncbi:PfaB family protein [Vibrio methylphosphonaticus]|uniref:PfaB family protein n=1 Tax=Vibrio methylphosphonaticus TaxID=2946866 RepID=UPI00202AC240|nr:PfaB family protein [Vibrio methylphosphonaticus]MCL9773980.1 PfaB family protein [Vibrio methylphosphonaticus]